jgi:ribose/xylose/arabinose/galactoside ABC-type transport system permease subunit
MPVPALLCLAVGLLATGLLRGTTWGHRVYAIGANLRAGNVYTLSAITAAVIGGVSLLGGRANLAGVVLGSLLVAAISNFLDLLAISSYWDEVWTGLIIIAAVGIYARGDGVVGARSTRFRWHRRKVAGAV